MAGFVCPQAESGPRDRRGLRNGKSQFLKKAARRSQNRNILLITTDARKARGPFGVFRQWIEKIQSLDLPASVTQELSALVNTRRLLSLLTGQTNDLPAMAGWLLPSPDCGDEQKDQLTVELVRFFSIVSRHRPLVLGVANFDAQDDESQQLAHRVLKGLLSCTVGLILTVDNESLAVERLPSELDITRLAIGPLNAIQSQGLIRQICKQHQLTNAFVEALSAHTAGNPARLLLTLWYLIEANHVVYTKTGWVAPSRVIWASLPLDLHHEVAFRLVALPPESSTLLKGMAAAGHLLDLPSLLHTMGWDRKRFSAAREEVNQVFPVFRASELEMESLVSTAILRSVHNDCTTETERVSWCLRIAAYLADSGGVTIHQEVAEMYEGGGRGEAALTYRIAAAHRAKSVACFDRAANNLEQ